MAESWPSKKVRNGSGRNISEISEPSKQYSELDSFRIFSMTPDKRIALSLGKRSEVTEKSEGISARNRLHVSFILEIFLSNTMIFLHLFGWFQGPK